MLVARLLNVLPSVFHAKQLCSVRGHTSFDWESWWLLGVVVALGVMLAQGVMVALGVVVDHRESWWLIW